MNNNDYMKLALEQAKLASNEGEVPVGAVIVKNSEIIATARNNREATGDATGHAELLAIREACAKLGDWHLHDCELYVTLEPCPMCMGAIIHSRVKRVVFGAFDPRAGACGSLIDLSQYPLESLPTITGGVLGEECLLPIRRFFREKRSKNETNDLKREV